jgi:hypothetical protein
MDETLMLRPAALFHRGQREPDRVKGGREVDGEAFVPSLRRERLDGRGVADAGVVDADVDGAERIDGRRDHRVDAAGHPQIGVRVQRADAV